MTKEDLQNSQQRTGSAEKGENRNQQKKITTNTSGSQQNDISRQAGLGRDRMTDVKDLGYMKGKDDYTGEDNDDLKNEDLTAANDQ